jgi:PAS domain S-box-containing protein
MKETSTDSAIARTADDPLRQIAAGRQADEILLLVVEATPNAIVLAPVAVMSSEHQNPSHTDAGAEQAETRIEEAEARTEQAEARTKQAEVRTEQAEARTEQAKTRTEQAEVRTEHAETRIEQAKSRTERAETRMEQAEVRTEQAELAAIWLESIAESSDDAIVGKDLNGIITSWNKGAERIFGYSAGETVGNSILLLIPDGQQDEENQILGRIKGGESIEHFETQRQTKDGRRIHISLTISPVKDAAGTIIGASKVARDITEKKQTEEARWVSEARYRTLFEHAPDGILIADPESRYLDANASMCRLLGYTREELIGLHASDIVCQSEIQHIGPALNTIKAGSEYHREWQFRRKDGSVFTAEVIATAMPDGNLLAMVRDVTERKRAEAAAALLVAIVESSDDAIIGEDLRGIVTSWNAGAAKEFGYPASEMIGQSIARLIPPELRDGEAEILGKIEWGESVPPYETQRVRKDGSIFDVSLTLSAIKDAAGRIVGASKVVRDITDHKKAEEKIRQLNAELEQRVIERTAELEAANKELEAFSYSVSHDLRAPLRAVDGFSQAVLEDFGAQLPEEGRQYLETIRHGAQKMGALIDDLLTFSRLSRAPLNKKEVNTANLVRDVLEDLDPRQTGRKIDFRIGELPPCAGDPALLKQVWMNLLSNACKYTQKRETAVVEIGCDARPEGDIFFVRDNGTGFDMRYGDKLFGVFNRLHRAEDFEGTGVGLAIVQRIIHRHGGRVWADAVVDRGATFYFTLKQGAKS